MPDGGGRTHAPAAGARRYSAGKREGARCCAGGEIDRDVVDLLVRFGWLSADEVDDPVRLSDAMADIADRWTGGMSTVQVQGVIDG